MVHERSTTRSEFSALDKSHYTLPGMVMLSITGVTLTRLLRWEKTRWKGVTILMQVAMNGSFCMANLSTKDFLMFLALFGFGFHICLHT